MQWISYYVWSSLCCTCGVKAHYGGPKLVQNESSFLSRKNCELKPFAINGIMNNIFKFSMSKLN
jgi:hypothetical protein